MQVSRLIEVVEERQGAAVRSIEIAAFEMGFVDKKQFEMLVELLLKSGYGKRLWAF